jgi:hypothetical protein
LSHGKAFGLVIESRLEKGVPVRFLRVAKPVQCPELD